MSAVQNSNVANAPPDAAPRARDVLPSWIHPVIHIDVDEEEASGGARSPQYAYVPSSPPESGALVPQVQLQMSSLSAHNEIDVASAAWSSSFLKTAESHPNIKLRTNDINLFLAILGPTYKDVDCLKALVIISGRPGSNGNLLEHFVHVIPNMLHFQSSAFSAITILNNLCKTVRDAEFIRKFDTTSKLFGLLMNKDFTYSMDCILLLYKLLTMTSDNEIFPLQPTRPIDSNFISTVLSFMSWDTTYLRYAADCNRAGLTVLFALLQYSSVVPLFKRHGKLDAVFHFLVPSEDTSSAKIALQILHILLLSGGNAGVKVVKWMSDQILSSTSTLDHIVLLVQFFATSCDFLLSRLVHILGEKRVVQVFQANGVSFEALPLLKEVLVKWVEELLLGCTDLSLIPIAETIGVSSELLIVLKRKVELASVGLSTLTRPPQFICPITMEEFVDPVIASDGKTYDRAALDMHFATSIARVGQTFSPLTREVLMPGFMKPNTDLKQLMESFHETALFIAKQCRTPLVEQGASSSGKKRVADDTAAIPAKRIYKTKASARKEARTDLP